MKVVSGGSGALARTCTCPGSLVQWLTARYTHTHTTGNNTHIHTSSYRRMGGIMVDIIAFRNILWLRQRMIFTGSPIINNALVLVQNPGLIGVHCFAFKMKCGVYTRPQITYTENNTCAHSVSECVWWCCASGCLARHGENGRESVSYGIHARTHTLALGAS